MIPKLIPGDMVRRTGSKGFWREVVVLEGKKLTLKHYDVNMVYDNQVEVFDYKPKDWEVYTQENLNRARAKFQLR